MDSVTSERNWTMEELFECISVILRTERRTEWERNFIMMASIMDTGRMINGMELV